MLVTFIICYIIAAVFIYFLAAANVNHAKGLNIVFALFWPIVMIIFLVEAYLEDRDKKQNK